MYTLIFKSVVVKLIKMGTKRLAQKDILKSVREDLGAVSSKEKKKKQERFFREKVNFIGCMHGDMRKVAKKYMKILTDDAWNYDDFLRLAEALMKRGTYEETSVALAMIEKFSNQFRKSDFKIFEQWLDRYITNWAHTDHISPHIFGELIEKYPELKRDVFEWTKSRNRWVRRAAAVTYVIHASNGKFHKQIFETADALLGDEEDMVQKGIGWMLKEASKHDEDTVVKFLLARTNKTSRLVLRYATEKVSKKNRKLVLSK